jgi:hypothetical protein
LRTSMEESWRVSSAIATELCNQEAGSGDKRSHSFFTTA